MPETVLTVTNALGTYQHKAWTGVSVTRSLEQFAGTFDVDFLGRSADDKSAPPIREGDVCKLTLDDEVVVTGYVDDSSVDADAQNLSMRVAGRSVAGDLVDCSAIHGKTGAWKNADLFTIASNLCAPFGVPAGSLNLVIDPTASADMQETFAAYAVQDGESVYETIERGCRAKGILLTSDADGTIRFTSVGTRQTTTTIFRGTDEKGRLGNVISGGRMGSWRERFSQVTVKAQSAGTAAYSGKNTSQQKYVVEDKDVTRYRPLLIKAEKGFGTAQKLQKRAVWERNVRAGRALKLRYTLDGWSNAEGIWHPNTLVHVKDDKLEVDTTMLVVSVVSRKSVTEGTNTDLELCDPRAMTVEPLTTQKKHKKGASYYVTGSAPNGEDDTSGSTGDE